MPRAKRGNKRLEQRKRILKLAKGYRGTKSNYQSSTPLATAGVAASFVGRCTYVEEEHFFSFRRTTHRGEPDYGRLISAIALT